ncbi:hypothetical protein [Rugosimonospora africana]|uniref:PE domain-containing protein n=1 Tax=Rugosimonospora africana TaxID=556532 RepID=A0A8J3R118_9ACTN|nr:hypothetical protein [Rugosimonospora africana]GIH21030.1 hypothetical protein Raf01_92020 [Rugosimonospora africana]
MNSGGSFRINVQAVNDFAQLLADQLDTVQRSAQTVAIFTRPPDLPLGAFAEAFSLGDDHSDEVAGVADLVAKVARSVDFARSVTTLVAQRYAALDAGGAHRIGAVVGDLSAPTDPLKTASPLPTVYSIPAGAGAPTGYATQPTAATTSAVSASGPATGTATPPPGSLVPPREVAQFEVPIPPAGGTVYYYDGAAAVQVGVNIQAQDA